jgi:hypothetical protein
MLGTHFYQMLSKSQVVRLEGLHELKKFNYLIGTQTPYLPPCSIYVSTHNRVPNIFPRCEYFIGKEVSEVHS